MGEKTQIQWTDATWNPWHGCKKVSPECKYCYMYRDKDRYGQDPTKIVRSKTKFKEPLKWKEPMKVFTCSWSDFFIEEADEWRAEAWAIIKATPHLTYQILTKRPERIKECLPDDWGDGYPNVWLGVSAGTQKSADKWIPILMEIPAVVRFISCEPLLEDIHIVEYLVSGKIHWVIIGGESGNENGKWRYRPCELDWVQGLANDSCIAGVACFIKQLGTHLAKKMRLKDKHGGDADEWNPNWMKLAREFPV